MAAARFAFLHVGTDATLANIFVRSVLVNNPDAEIVQCSDSWTPPIPGATWVHRIAGDASKLMLFRTSAWARLPTNGPTAFCDADMICQAKLDLSAALGDNDIALCRRVFDLSLIHI